MRVINTELYNIKSELHIFEPRCEKTGLRGFTNKAVQPQKVARGLKFCINEVKGLYYPCSE